VRAFRDDPDLHVPQRHQSLRASATGMILRIAPLGVAHAPRVPAAQRAVRLKLQPAPGELHHQAADPFVAALVDAACPSAVVAVEFNPEVVRKNTPRLRLIGGLRDG